MLFLQCKKRRDYVFIIIAVCLSHAALLLFFCLARESDIVSLALATQSRNSAPILFRSTQIPQKIINKKNNHPAVQVEKKEIIPTIPVVDNAPAVKQKKDKQVQKTIQKEDTPKKIISGKNKVAKKIVQKKIEPKKEIIKIQPQAENKKIENEKRIEEKSVIIDADRMDHAQMKMIDENIAEHIIALRTDIANAWSAPPGIDNACWCKVQVMVGFDGIIKQLDIQESSGVLIYDMTVRRALLQAQLPAWIRGKTLIITFKQCDGDV